MSGGPLDESHVRPEDGALLDAQAAVEQDEGLVVADETQRVHEAHDPDERGRVGHRVERDGIG
jgi:hypothetical protein